MKTETAGPGEEIVAPASYIQRSMWAAAQRHRHAPLNVMILPWRVRGAIDLPALRRALVDLVERHHSLRTRLANVDGQLMQIVAPEPQVMLNMRQADGDGDESRLRTAVAMLRERGCKPMDLATGSVFEPWLIALTPDDHILCFFAHHAMCDGWSSILLINDLVALYGAQLQGQAAELPTIDHQYVDFAKAQIAAYEAGGFADQIAYWVSELSNPPQTPVTLPTVAPRKGNRDWLARSPMVHSPASRLAALRQLARHQRVSVFSVLLSALAVLLHHRTGAEDLIIGVPVLGRWSPAAMHVVGCATNMLPARIRLHGALGFDALVTQVHGTIRRLMAYGRVPLELILRETQGTVVGGLPFPVWCQFRESTPPAMVAATGMTLSPFVVERGTLLTELDVDMLGGPDGLDAEFAYRPALFGADMVDELMRDYAQLLALIPDLPTLDVASLQGRACARVSGLTGSAAPS